MKTWLIIVLALVASTSSAGTSSRLSGRVATMPAGQTPRVTYLCVVPDIQNQTTYIDDEVGGEDMDLDCSCGSLAPATCTVSPWCHGNWRETGATILRAMAYEMTGQLGRMAWQFRGPMPARSENTLRLSAGLARPCDLVAQVGDWADHGEPYDSTTAFSAIPADVVSEVQSGWRNFFEILKDAGTPFVVAQGNHDATMAYKQYLSTSILQTLPDYYSVNPNYATGNRNAAWAVLTQTPAGPICAITFGCSVETEALSWMADQVGCGVGAPTVLVSHYSVWGTTGFIGTDNTCEDGTGTVAARRYVPNDGTSRTTQGGTAATIQLAASDTTTEVMALGSSWIELTRDGGAAVGCVVEAYDFATKTATVTVDASCNLNVTAADADDTYRWFYRTPYWTMAGKDDSVFLNAFGHQVSGSSFYCQPCSTTDAVAANAVLGPVNAMPLRTVLPLQVFPNWQEANRVGASVGEGLVYGQSGSDGLGGFWTIVEIVPERDVINVVPWNSMTQDNQPSAISGLSTSLHTEISTHGYDWCGLYLGGAC